MKPLYEVMWENLTITLEVIMGETIFKLKGKISRIVEFEDTDYLDVLPYMVLTQTANNMDVVIPLWSITGAEV